jgi:hypothetical protein
MSQPPDSYFNSVSQYESFWLKDSFCTIDTFHFFHFIYNSDLLLNIGMTLLLLTWYDSILRVYKDWYLEEGALSSFSCTIQVFLSFLKVPAWDSKSSSLFLFTFHCQSNSRPRVCYISLCLSQPSLIYLQVRTNNWHCDLTVTMTH